MTSTNRLTLPRGSSPHASPESKAEVARLEAEVSRLKLLLRDKSSGAKALSVDATARAFMLEDSSSYPTLEPFTSRKEKFALLDKGTRIQLVVILTWQRSRTTMEQLWLASSFGSSTVLAETSLTSMSFERGLMQWTTTYRICARWRSSTSYPTCWVS